MSRRGKGQRCTYCDRALEGTRSHSRVAATKDHTVPACRGGREKVWCCRQCNTLKADMTPDQWGAFMTAHPMWWTLPQFQVGTVRKGRGGGPPRPESVAREVLARIGLVDGPSSEAAG